MIKPSDLKPALEHVLAGISTEEERRALQVALLGGQLVFTAGERDVTAGRDIRDSIIIIADRSHVSVDTSEPDYERLRENLFPRPKGLPPPFPSLIFIGRDAALLEVKNLVGATGQAAAKGATTTVLRGWPGVGKTTLVGALGRDGEVAKAFPDGVLWVMLGQSPNLLSELARWGRQLGTDELLRAPTLHDATAQLRFLLQRKRMLLIVDDVWDSKHAIPFFEACGESNSLLITTRESLAVAAELEDQFAATIHRLPELTEEDALKLIRVLAPTVAAKHPEGCRDLVQTLECLPLSLQVAGRLLNWEAKLGWGVEDLLEDLKNGDAILRARTPADRKEATVSALLNKSTDLLSETARDCFAFLGPFAPKPATFDLEAIRSMWEMDDPKPIISELVGHGLLEPQGDRFQMHALLVAHARSMLTE